jgi:hypothetical protein
VTLGLSLDAFLILHVAISMVAIFAGFIVLGGMFSSAPMPGWTAFFLLTTILTSVTGFMFPVGGFTPALAVGAVSILLLAVALAALYARRLDGRWRAIYVVSAVAALYLNVFVFVVQSFQKVGFLQALAPTQGEPPFAIAQTALLIGFVLLGWMAVRRFRPARPI